MKLSFATCRVGVSTSLVLFGCGSQTTLTMENTENAQAVTTLDPTSTCPTIPWTIDPSNPPDLGFVLPICDPGFIGTGRGDPGRGLTPEEFAASEAEAALNQTIDETVPPNAVDEDPFVATTTSSTTTAITTTSTTTGTTTTLAPCVFSGLFSPVDNCPNSKRTQGWCGRTGQVRVLRPSAACVGPISPPPLVTGKAACGSEPLTHRLHRSLSSAMADSPDARI